MNTVFSKSHRRLWTGRYAMPKGGTKWTNLNVDGNWFPSIKWKNSEYEEIISHACKSNAAIELGSAIAEAKIAMGGNGGGSFLINEFSQVIVPSSAGDGKRMIVGELDGELTYNNPAHESASDITFRLSDDEMLAAGNKWSLPYIGIQYNLNARSQIYFWKINDDGGEKEVPNQQDSNLINAIRSIRPSGAAGFIVNPAGICLTKKPPESGCDDWETIYIGRIDKSQWFKKD